MRRKVRLSSSRRFFLANGENIQIGQPAVPGMRVLGEVVKHTSTKLYIQHFRRRKNYRRLKGHRQPYILVKINQFLNPGDPTPQPANAPVASTAPVPAPAV